MRKSQWRTGAFCESTGYGNRQFVTLDKNNTGTAYKYIFLDAPGNISDYMELDVAGKIVFVSMDGLSFADKGTYVQAYVFARNTEAGGTEHSIPVLAFYGDWSEPAMFDRGTLMELMDGSADKLPYLNEAVGFYGNALGIDYGNGKEYYYGGNPVVDDEHYLPQDVNTIEEKEVFSGPQYGLEFNEIPGRDGDLIRSGGRFPNVQVT